MTKETKTSKALNVLEHVYHNPGLAADPFYRKQIAEVLGVESNGANRSTRFQAEDYVARVGFDEARKSTHYMTAKAHCTCGACFCCEVRNVVDSSQKPLRNVIKERQDYQPKTGVKCTCKRGQQRDNCPQCEGTGWVIDFKAIRERRVAK